MTRAHKSGPEGAVVKAWGYDHRRLTRICVR